MKEQLLPNDETLRLSTHEGAPRLLTYDEASRLLGIKRATLYSLVWGKRIPHIRFGNRFVKFSLEALQAWVKEHEVMPVIDGQQQDGLGRGAR